MHRIAVVLLLVLLGGCATVPPPAREPQPAVPAPAEVPARVPGPGPSVAPEEPPGTAQPAVPPRMQGLEAFAELNDEKLLYVYPGMSMAAVERVMGGRRSGSYVNPYKRQMIVTVDGRAHEVLFYLTRAPRSGRRVTESQLTPVIFVNNRVTAIGRYPLKKLRRSACQAAGVGNCP